MPVDRVRHGSDPCRVPRGYYDRPDKTALGESRQRATSRRTGIFLAALLFGVVHLPNPFLAPVTVGAALLWCWLYDRYPNILPLALSHALGTLAVLHAFDQDITGRLRIGAAYLRLGE